MGTETIADAEVKLGGVDASSPTGTSVVMNILAPRGGNVLKGSVQYEGAKFDWNSDNTQNSVAPGGTPTSQSVNQWDVALGGPIQRNKVWAFGAFRYSDLGIGVSRLPLDLQFLTTFRPDFVPFNNTRKGNQQFAKVTTQASSNHEITAFYQYPARARARAAASAISISCAALTRAAASIRRSCSRRGRSRLTTSISGSYNNKGGNTLTAERGHGPQMTIHQSAPLSRGVPTGTGVLVMGDNDQSVTVSPASIHDHPRRPDVLQRGLAGIARIQDRLLGRAAADAPADDAILERRLRARRDAGRSIRTIRTPDWWDSTSNTGRRRRR